MSLLRGATRLGSPMAPSRFHPSWLVVAALLALPQGGCSSAVSPETEADAGGPPPAGDASSELMLSSPAFENDGTLPVLYSCDGAGLSPPLEWTGAPKGTVEFALLMTTLGLDGMRWNWVLYGLTSNVTSLAENSQGVGTAGLTSDGPDLTYYPPCAQGPGPKTYTFSVYALSGTPTFDVPANQVTGQVLTDASGQLTVASSQLSVTYTR
jgi:phosphatidylethanolamine-binding protein (PEBP) family uncharacterized protein